MPVLIALGAGLAAWLLVMGVAARGRRERERRAQLLARVRGDATERTAPKVARQRRAGLGLRRRPGGLALRQQRRGLMARIAASLTRAGMEVSPSEFVLITLGLGLMGLFIGGLVWESRGMLGGLLVGLVLPPFQVRRRAGKRRSKINAQLNDLLQLVAGGLTAGQSFLQSLSAAGRELGDPLGTELRVLLNEVELGATVEAALSRLRDRVRDDDLDLVIDAVLIQRRVGGNLSEVLSNISWTIRERIRIRGEVKTLTGQARLSGWVLGGLPIGLAGVLLLMNPEYMSPLYTTSIGRALMAGGGVGQLLGFLFMRKIANVKV